MLAINTRLTRRSLLVAMAAGGLAAGRGASAADADPATARITAFYAVLLESMKSAQRTPVKTRYDKLDPAVRATFDLPAMTRISVGPAWATLAPDDQQALLEQFARMTVATYASRFDGYSGERFEVDPKTEARGENRVVKSTLVQAKGEPIALNYLSHVTPDGWKAYDVYLSGTISELATRRSEFGAVLKAGGASALIASLRPARRQDARRLSERCRPISAGASPPAVAVLPAQTGHRGRPGLRPAPGTGRAGRSPRPAPPGAPAG